MRSKQSKFILVVAISFLACLVGLWVSHLSRREPNYQGHSLSYWLEALQPTIITTNHETVGRAAPKFRDMAAAAGWIEQENQMRQLEQRSSDVLKDAGPECLPILFSQLTTQPKRKSVRTPAAVLRQWAFTLRLVGSSPTTDEDEIEVRRGQALTAIVVLGERASPLVPRLSELAAKDTEDAVTRAASYALYEIAPGEFQRIRSPQLKRP